MTVWPSQGKIVVDGHEARPGETGAKGGLLVRATRFRWGHPVFKRRRPGQSTGIFCNGLGDPSGNGTVTGIDFLVKYVAPIIR